MNRVKLTIDDSDKLWDDWNAYFYVDYRIDQRLSFFPYFHSKDIDLQYSENSAGYTLPENQYVFFLLRYPA